MAAPPPTQQHMFVSKLYSRIYKHVLQNISLFQNLHVRGHYWNCRSRAGDVPEPLPSVPNRQEKASGEGNSRGFLSMCQP